ncbi:MAG: hypothetical protein HLUCCO16_01140 [Phormidium sp. OSCR]|nr:MAG: hypothetical protein HLUCCO16_01140 [Phormidium sp. OSCR]
MGNIPVPVFPLASCLGRPQGYAPTSFPSWEGQGWVLPSVGGARGGLSLFRSSLFPALPLAYSLVPIPRSQRALKGGDAGKGWGFCRLFQVNGAFLAAESQRKRLARVMAT